MTDLNSHPHGFICIGGPMAGLRVATLNNNPRFVAKDPVPSGKFNSPIPRKMPPPTTYVIDKISGFDGGGGPFQFRFWRPEDQPLSKTLHILLEAYAKGAKS